MRRVVVLLALVTMACGSAPRPPAPTAHIECSDAWPIGETARPPVHPSVPMDVLDGPASLLEHDRRDSPIDFVTLPRAEVLARREGTTSRAWIAGDLLIRDVGELRVEAYDLRSLETRWTTEAGWSRHAVGCDRVVQTTTGSVRALDVRTGNELWRRDLGGRVLPDVVAVEGCRVLLELEGGGADGSMLEVWILDAITGRPIARHRFGEPGTARMASEDEAVAWLRERSMAIPLDGGEPVPVPPRTVFLGATRAIQRSDHELHGRDRGTQAIAWSRTFDDRPAILARTGDDLVVATRGEIRRISMETGEDRWTLAVPLELTGHAGAPGSRPPAAEVTGGRLILSTDTEPPLVAQIEIAEGVLSWILLAPQPSHAVTAAGDVAVIWTQGSLAALVLPSEGRPAATIGERDARMRGEIQRALRLLALPEGERSGDAYPGDAEEARAWLERLRSIAGPILVEEIRAASDRDAALGIQTLEGEVAPSARALVEELLRRSFGPPTPHRMALRAAASRAVSAPLSPGLARALADETLAWSRDLRRGPPHTCGPHPSDPLADAVHASLAAIERGSTDPEPLRRVRESLFAHRRAGECTPSEDDAVRTAAVRWVIEAGVWFDGIDAAEGACIDLVDPDGRSLERVHGPYHALQVFSPERLHREEGGAADAGWPPPVADPAWDDAPTRTIELATGSGMQGERITLVMRRVGGEWRVIARGPAWAWTT